MPLDPAQRYQIEQDAITAAWEAERLAAGDGAIALLREIADRERDDDVDVIIGTDADGHNDLMSRVATFLATHNQYGNAMTKLTKTQTTIFSAGAQRPENIALPLPKGLAGAAAKMAVNRMVELGWLQEVGANLRRGETLWRETGDGNGTTLVVTDARLLAIRIDPVAAQMTTAIRNDAAERPKLPKQRAGTKQAMLIAMLKASTGATMEEIISATGWQAHSARGAMSGALGKKLGLIVTSAKEADRGRVYRINLPAS